MKSVKAFNRKRTNIPAEFHPLSKTMTGVLVTLQRKYVNLPEWYRSQARQLVREYYRALRQVLRESVPSHRWLARCRQCGIFF